MALGSRRFGLILVCSTIFVFGRSWSEKADDYVPECRLI